MSAAVDLEAIEASLLASAPKDVANLPDPANIVTIPEVITAPDAAPALDASDLMTLAEFRAGWGMVHHLGGAALSQRIGAEVALGDQAMSETGQEACKAAYDLARANPTIARMVLSKSHGTLGKIAALAVHGFTCIQLVKAARVQAAQADRRGDDEPDFQSVRKAA